MKTEIDVQAAASAVPEEPRLSLETMSEQDRTNFLTDDLLPGETKPKSDDAQKAVETGAASDAAKHDQESADEEPPPRETRAQRRIRQLNDKVKTLEAQIAQRGTERPSELKAAAASPSKAPKLKSFTDQIGTKYTDYDSAHEAWEDAQHGFYADERKTAVTEALKTEREALNKTTAEETAKKTGEAQGKEFAKRAETFRKTLKQDSFVESFTDVKEAVDEAMVDNPDWGEFSAALVESEVGPELIHYFGQNPDAFDALLAMPVSRALRELGKLEVSDKIKAPTPKTRTAAKRIGTDVGGRSAASSDPEEEAVNKRDMIAFLKADGSLKATESIW